MAASDLPTTVDDFVDLMYRFANEDPNQSGKKDTYGMSTTMIGALLGRIWFYTGFTEGAAEWSEENGALIINDVRPPKTKKRLK